jgi:hypothetical protein
MFVSGEGEEEGSEKSVGRVECVRLVRQGILGFDSLGQRRIESHRRCRIFVNMH